MTRQDRLATLEAVRAAGISVCAGGIIGLGEGPTDRVGLLHQLATLREHPESVPINALARPCCLDPRCLEVSKAVRFAGIPMHAWRLSEGPTSITGLLHQLAMLRAHPEVLPLHCAGRMLRTSIL